MSAFVAGGGIFAVILALTFVEAGALVAWHRRTGRGMAAVDVIGHLAAGCCMLVASIMALRGAWWGFPCAFLVASGLSHVFDLRRRMRRAR